MWMSLLVACGKTPSDAVEPPSQPVEAPADVPTPEPAPEEPGEQPVAGEGTSRVVRVADIDWTPVVAGAPQGAQLAVLSGDPATGPVGALMQLPAGSTEDLHKHSAEHTAVVLSGVAAHGAQPGKLTNLSAGGYWIQPAGEASIDACTGEAACILYVGFEGSMDRIPARGPARVSTMTVVTADDVAWGPVDGAEVAVLAGDLESESRVLMRVPPGYHSGLRTHAAGYVGAVVQGTVGHGPTEQGLTALQPGSIIEQAAGEPHATACSGGDPCVLVLELAGALDFVAVASEEPAGGEGESAAHKGPAG